VPDRPAYIVSGDGRSAWVNTTALQLANITRHTPDPAAGAIEKDVRSGEPTGVLRNAAMALAAGLVPRPTREERARALRAAIASAHENGITSVQDAVVGTEDFDVYEEARRGGDLNVRVYSSIAVGRTATEADFSRLEALSGKYPDDPLFKVGGARIALDGPLDSGDAALVEADASRGVETSIGPDELNRLVRLLDARGWQVTTEAFGDRAVRMAVDAYQHAVRSNPRPARGRRHVLAHAGLVDAADLPRLAALGIMALLHPLEATPLAGRLDSLLRTTGAERAARAWPAASIADAGTRVAFSTGWPEGSLSPMEAIHAAVSRSTLDGSPDGGWNPKERVTLKRAVTAFTSAAAYVSFDEQRKGSLKAGMLADIVVLSDDIFKAPVSRLAGTTVAFTIFDGKIVYRRSARSTD
jgi:predicted amidohydrolase YtcJ